MPPKNLVEQASKQAADKNAIRPFHANVPDQEPGFFRAEEMRHA